MLAASLCLFLCGCVSTLAKNSSAEANILSGVYLKQLDKTTPEQDKAHIKAMDAEIQALDAAVRGTAAAQATRALVK